MQSLKSARVLRNPVSWGVAAMVFAVVVTLVVAYIYYNTPGKNKIVSFYTDDANSIRTGDSVRMAGITVGTVTGLALESHQVKVTAKIDDHAFVGDQSQVDVRMLTVVGGYYVNIASIGNARLAGQTIPLSRVTMPYSLVRALTDSTKITDNVNPKPINESLDQIAQGLTGTNVQVVANAINAGNAIMSSVDRQRGQVTKILDMSDEYIKSLANYRDKLTDLVRKISLLTQTMVIYDRGLTNTLVGIRDALQALKPLGDFYEMHRVQFIERVREFLERGRIFTERNGLTIRLLKRFQDLFDRVLDAQNAPPGLLATDLCIPTPESPC
jgi:phospholipid/cholesterol/gamma-HCH transport system substrate-binding protein